MGGAPMGGYGAAPGAPGGPPMGGPGFPPPPTFSTSSGGGLGSGNTLKAIGGGVGGVVLLIAFIIFKVVVRTGVSSVTGQKGTESLSGLGIDKKKGDPDKMIAAARAFALKWKGDAGFWSVNIQQLGSDGTVDLNGSNVMVEYFSPSAVSSPLTSVRDDSIKKFNFMNDDMTYRDIWGVRKQYTPAPKATSIPGCTARMLAQKLNQAGYFKGKSSLHVQIDPALGDEWLVQTGSGPRRFDLQTCTEKK
jgi:hypothetical protein